MVAKIVQIHMTTQSEELNERKKNWWPSEVIASFFPLPVVCLIVVGKGNVSESGLSKLLFWVYELLISSGLIVS